MTEDTLKDGIHLDDAKSQEQQTLLLQQLSTYIEELPHFYHDEAQGIPLLLSFLGRVGNVTRPRRKRDTAASET